VKAVVYTDYGPPDVLTFQEVEKPAPKDDEVLIKIQAVSLNRSDWEGLIGKPLYARIGGLRRPGRQILGSDIAGQVEAAGSRHSRFRPGDEVFGDILGQMGGFAEYVCVRGTVMALKPACLTFEQASTLPQSGIIALQGIRTKGRVQRGQKVLINGAGGGTGVFAIQLAKLHGAEVTGVDNGGKLDFMRSVGADHVLDYTRADFTRGKEKYDLVLDLVAHRSAFAYARSLRPGGTYYFVGGSVATLFQVLLAGPLIRRMTGKNVRLLAVQPSREDLETVAALCVDGKLAPAIDRRFRLSEVPLALRYLGEGRAMGKVVITMDGDPSAT
jgi:NADPH:quinone reductase-like Zn-dependent oxidoreductase